ncbi:hypothetical protein [Anaerococcus tetradius]|uniref:Uncharacterized protein n=1 Tax=Anaerococcus tetradius TaxID=33036 RepID=A0A133KGJ7_9FIRM|nr:hypothetical protein [Anaerococcus tetradius]KWZ78628.1 hypothetical protein HMPREF3200_00640 [Anaerococcus tetradius]
MNNIKTIIKYAFKEQFFPYFPSKRPQGLPKNYLLRLISILWSFLFLGFMYYIVMGAALAIFIEIGKEDMYFTIFGMLTNTIVIFIYGIKMYGDFFNEKSIENYVPMPIGQGELFLGKIIGAVLSFFDFFLFFLLGLVLYFSQKAMDVGTLILGIINFFPMIAIPYSILAIILLIIKRFTNVNRYKKVFKNLGYLVMFAIIGTIYYFSFQQNKGGSNDNFDRLANGLVNTFGKNSGVSNIFFNAKLFGLSLTGSLFQRLLASLILIGLALGLLFIAYKLADKNYYKAVFDRAITSEGAKKIKKTKKTKRVSIKKSSQVKALVKRDLRILTSNLMFVYTPMIMALVFSMMAIGQKNTIINDFGKELEINPQASVYVFAIALAIGLIIWINGNLTSSCLSREGKGFYLIQSLPIDAKSHLRARLISAMLVSSLINLIISLVVGITLKLGLVNILMIMIGLSLSALASNIVGLLMSTVGINTSWKNPKELAQGGIRAIIYYIISMVFVIILVGVFILLMNITKGNLLISLIVPMLILVILTLIFYIIALGRYENGFMDV